MKKGHYIAIIFISLLLIAATIYVLVIIPTPIEDIPSNTANSSDLKSWFSQLLMIK